MSLRIGNYTSGHSEAQFVLIRLHGLTAKCSLFPGPGLSIAVRLSAERESHVRVVVLSRSISFCFSLFPAFHGSIPTECEPRLATGSECPGRPRLVFFDMIQVNWSRRPGEIRYPSFVTILLFHVVC
jgi:hypothetical protein